MIDRVTLDGWRAKFERVHKAIIACQGQFLAWFEEAKTAEPKTDEVRELINEILQYESHYQRAIRDLPMSDKFTYRELQNRSGNVERISNIGEEMIRLGTILETKVAKLRALLKEGP